jgi:hypothetical protein
MMGFSNSQSPSLRDIQAVSASLTDAALTDNALQLRRIAAGMRNHVRGIEQDLAELRRAARTLPQLVKRSTDDEVDAWEHTTRLCRKLEAKARSLRPATYPLVRQITGAAESWYRPYLRVLRDLRWDIMALQAERVEGQGPVMATASDVDAYFRSLPPAA